MLPLSSRFCHFFTLLFHNKYLECEYIFIFIPYYYLFNLWKHKKHATKLYNSNTFICAFTFCWEVHHYHSENDQKSELFLSCNGLKITNAFIRTSPSKSHQDGALATPIQLQLNCEFGRSFGLTVLTISTSTSCKYNEYHHPHRMLWLWQTWFGASFKILRNLREKNRSGR